jgi:hypothetical protein
VLVHVHLLFPRLKYLLQRCSGRLQVCVVAGSSGTIKLCHPEVLYVTLVTDERGSGIVLENIFDNCDEVLREPPLVSHVIIDSPAYW